MVPVRLGVLEMKRRDCFNVNDVLSQCLFCGSLIWSRADLDTPECRCTSSSSSETHVRSDRKWVLLDSSAA